MKWVLSLVAASLSSAAAQDIDTIVVTADRLGAPLTDTPAAISVLTDAERDLVSPRAPAELLNRVPGVFVQAGSGQGAAGRDPLPRADGRGGGGQLLVPRRTACRCARPASPT